MISPVAMMNGNRRGPTAAWLGPTSNRDVWTAMKMPSARTPPPSTPSPIRRLRSVVMFPPSAGKRAGKACPVVLSLLLHQPNVLECCLDLSPILLEEGCELIGWLVHVEPAALLQGLLPGGALDHAVDRSRQNLPVSVANLGAGHNASPVDQADVNPLLLERRHVNARKTIVGGDRDASELTRFSRACA